jgi:hypothetical protein
MNPPLLGQAQQAQGEHSLLLKIIFPLMGFMPESKNE